MEIQCIFYNYTNNDERFYCCSVWGQQIPENRELKFIGQHHGGRSNNFVTHVEFSGCKVTKVPQGLTKIFPKLKILSIHRSKLKKICKTDLAEYKNLTKFWCVCNKIQFLPGNLFNDLKNLEFIGFNENKLEVIEPNILDGLDKLKYVNFKDNPSYGKFYSIYPEYYPNATLEEVKFELIKNCNIYYLESKFKAQVHHLNDSESRLKTQVQQLIDSELNLNQKVQQLSDSESKLNHQVQQLIDSESNLNQKIQKLSDSESNLKKQVQQLIDSESKLNQKVQQLSDSESKLKHKVLQLIASESNLNQKVQQLSDSESNLNQKVQQLSNSESKLKHQVQQLIDSESNLNQKVQQLSDSESNLNQKVLQLIDSESNLKTQVQQLSDSESNLKRQVQQLSDSESKLNQQNQQLSDSESKLKHKVQQLIDSESNLNQQVQQLSNSESNLKTQVQQLSDSESKLVQKNQQLRDKALKSRKLVKLEDLKNSQKFKLKKMFEENHKMFNFRSRNGINADIQFYLYAKNYNKIIQIKIDDEHFPIHRKLFAAQSPTFATFVNQNPQAQWFEIPEMSIDILVVIFEFLYEKKLPKYQIVNLLDVYEAANYLKITRLMNHIVAVILDQINQENAFDFLKIGHKYKIKVLQLKAFKRIKISYPLIQFKDELINQPAEIGKKLERFNAAFLKFQNEVKDY